MKKNRRMTHSLHRAAQKYAKAKRFVPVIVEFSGASHKKHAGRLMKKLGGRCRHKGHLWLIRGWAARVAPSCLKTICAHKQVAKVYLDRKNRTKLNIATPAVGSAAVQKSGATGKGVGIAIIDTGVAPRPDLTKPANRIAAFKDFVNGRTKPYDDNGHGTHVSGDAAGNGYSSKGKYKGTAPEARIIGVKVLDRQGVGLDSTIIRGIQWCVANRKRYGIRVLNLSLGKPAEEACADDPLCRAVEKAVQAGLVVTAAAGNDGPLPASVTSPGTSPSAITVGAVDDRRTVRQSDDRIADFSGRGPAAGGLSKPDLVAPGVNIVSLRVPGSELAELYPANRVGSNYIRLSGTSFSAPITAGAIAQLLQKRSGLRPASIKRLLQRHGFNLKLPTNTQGSGELNVRFLAGRTGGVAVQTRSARRRRSSSR
ncbi:S8 family peptidase [Paenibacillus doosanensis]|uniref:S8 family peptidase n=1 Tax=Paenibacillus doosanensis TaxID=1229154 RepID=UPI00217FD495|nr:S8 family peptidase [Paenibacillus doosanensis]MCS7463622.1 S8 family peptidase [Paenibacillus doosanensis]